MYKVSKMYIQKYRWVDTKVGHIRYHLSRYLPTYLLRNEYSKDVNGLVVGSKVGHIQNPLSRYLPTYLLVSCIMYKFREMNVKICK